MILLCRTIAAATAPPGPAELEDLRTRVERLEESTPEMTASQWKALSLAYDQPRPEDDHMMIVGEYTVRLTPSYTKGFRCICCGAEIPLVEINDSTNRPLRVTGQVLDSGMVLVIEGLCPSCCVPRDCRE